MNVVPPPAVQAAAMPLERVALQATGARRALLAELAGIAHEMRSFQECPDTLSLDIEPWHRGFFTALHANQEVGPILDRYLSLLQEILVDPITGTPLGKEALLGSDGFCYGHDALCLFMHGLPENLRQRSPLDLDNPEQPSFVTKPHLLARHLVSWLERHGARQHAPEIRRSFTDLTNHLGERGVRLLVPTLRNHRLRRIQEIARRRREQAEANRLFEEQLLEAERRQISEVQRVFSALSMRAEEAASRTLTQLDQVEQRSAQKMEQLDREIARVEARVNALRKEVSALEEQISHTEGDLRETERETLVVEKEIKEIEVAIEKRKRERARSLHRALLTAAGCIAVTLSLPGSMALLPTKEGATLSLPPIKL